MKPFDDLVAGDHQSATGGGEKPCTVRAGPEGKILPFPESGTENLMQHLLFGQPLSHSSPPGRRGFTRAELLWAILLLGAMVWVILGTKAREMDQTRIQQARDTLIHLAAMLEMESPTRAPSGWPSPLLGPGTLPAGLAPGPRGRIHDIFPGLWVPPDPWGHALVLRRFSTPDGVRAELASAGPEGRLPEPGDENGLQVSFPYRRD